MRPIVANSAPAVGRSPNRLHAPLLAASPACSHRGHSNRARRRPIPCPRCLPRPDRARVRGKPPHLAGRKHDRVFRDDDRLGGQPLRPGDLAGGGRRRALPAHPHRTGEQHGTAVVARRIPAGLHRRPGRRRAGLRHPSGGRGGRAAHFPRRWDQRLPVLARWQPDRLRGHRSRSRRLRGARRTLRRLRGRGRGLPHDPPLGDGSTSGRRTSPIDGRGRLHDRRRLRRQRVRMVARRSRDRLRPHADAPGQFVPARRHFRRRCDRGNGSDAGRGSQLRAEPHVVAGRLTHPLFHHRGRQPVLRQHGTRRNRGGRRRAAHPDRRFRREPGASGLDGRRGLLRRVAAHRAPPLRARSRVGRGVARRRTPPR